MLVFRGRRGGHLKLLHGSDVGGLDVVLELLDLLAESIQRDLLVLDDKVDLELLDAETDGDKLGGTPDETVLLNATDSSLEGSHVSLVICIFELVRVNGD